MTGCLLVLVLFIEYGWGRKMFRVQVRLAAREKRPALCLSLRAVQAARNPQRIAALWPCGHSLAMMMFLLGFAVHNPPTGLPNSENRYGNVILFGNKV